MANEATRHFELPLEHTSRTYSLNNLIIEEMTDGIQKATCQAKMVKSHCHDSSSLSPEINFGVQML